MTLHSHYLYNGATAQTFTANASANKTWTSFYAPTSAGTKGQVLTSNGSGAPTWKVLQGTILQVGSNNISLDPSSNSYDHVSDISGLTVDENYMLQIWFGEESYGGLGGTQRDHKDDISLLSTQITLIQSIKYAAKADEDNDCQWIDTSSEYMYDKIYKKTIFFKAKTADALTFRTHYDRSHAQASSYHRTFYILTKIP